MQITVAAPQIDWMPLVDTLRRLVKNKKWIIEFKVAKVGMTLKVNGVKVSLAKGDTFAFVEDDNEESYIVTVGQKKLGDLTQRAFDKVEENSTLKKVKMSDFVGKKATPPAKSVKKPTAPAKPKAETKVDPYAVGMRILKGTVPTEAEYMAVSWIGIDRSTNRIKNSQQAVTMGPADIKGLVRLSSYATDDKVVYNKALTIYDLMLATAEERAAKIPYSRYKYLFAKWTARLEATRNLRDAIKKNAEEKTRDLGIDYNSEGKEALIQFSDGQYWKTIEKVDTRNQKIGIKGSGSKLRWLSNSHVLELRDMK